MCKLQSFWETFHFWILLKLENLLNAKNMAIYNTDGK